MKKQYCGKALAAALILGSLFLSGCGRSADFGVVDMGKVERESTLIISIKDKGQEQLQKLLAETEKELQGKSEKDRLKIVQEYRNRVQIVQSSVSNNIQNQIQGVVHQVAMEKGLGAVLVKECALDGGTDLTDLILKKLQEEEKSQNSKKDKETKKDKK